jgi:hypothetical protein
LIDVSIPAIMENRVDRAYSQKHSLSKGNQMTEKNQTQTAESPSIPELLEVDTSKISSVVLARLIEEVRNEKSSTTRVYDRVHNRHNRGR